MLIKWKNVLGFRSLRAAYSSAPCNFFFVKLNPFMCYDPDSGITLFLTLFLSPFRFSLRTLLLVRNDEAKVLWLNFGSQHVDLFFWGGGSFSVEVELIYNVVLISSVQQNDSILHTHT